MYNTRASAMWDIIEMAWPVGCTFADLGCGYGDFCYNALTHDLYCKAIPIDIDAQNIAITREKCKDHMNRMVGFVADLNEVGVIS